MRRSSIKEKVIFYHHNRIDIALNIPPDIEEFIERARVARLATIDSEFKPHLVPVVFAFDGSHFFIPVDKKRKTTKPEKLRRIKNIQDNPNVALLIDEYSEDWTRLAFVMMQGKASILRTKIQGDIQLKQAYNKLTKKYPQYQKIGIGEMCIMITPEKVVSWRNSHL
ncbi:MAG: TIGR03668 family PPOX class F420-dependent oxidoreductase [Thermoproteota archaeon]|nr:TIGR03668 family PPOX class F420-dependent oxidoreductase [Thermoproteota archaeon]